MIAYQKIETVANDDSLPTYTPTPEGVAMGNTPNWIMLLDPDYISSTAVKNRVFKDSMLTTKRTPTTVTSSNGQTLLKSNAFDDLLMLGDAGVDKTSFSTVFVAKPTARTSDQSLQSVVSAKKYNNGAGNTFNIAFSAAATHLVFTRTGYVSDLNRILSYKSPNGGFSNSLNVFVVTYSVKNGLSMRVNGEQVAKLNNVPELDNQYKAGEWSVLQGALGEYGMIGMLNTDLSDPQNKFYLNSIEQFLMSKYGITTP